MRREVKHDVGFPFYKDTPNQSMLITKEGVTRSYTSQQLLGWRQGTISTPQAGRKESSRHLMSHGEKKEKVRDGRICNRRKIKSRVSSR